MTTVDPVRAVLSAANGQIVGRIRIQKIFYLLEQLGLKSGFEFSYHHYGPYSEDLSRELTIESAFSDDFQEEYGYTQKGAKFSIYKLSESHSNPELAFGDFDHGKVVQLIQTLKQPQSVVIELAATIHWLKHEEKVTDWKAELRERKPEKASDKNIAKAETLLAEIGLT